MLEILQFVFSSFWVFAGSLLILVVIAGALAAVFQGPFVSITHVHQGVANDNRRVH